MFLLSIHASQLFAKIKLVDSVNVLGFVICFVVWGGFCYLFSMSYVFLYAHL